MSYSSTDNPNEFCSYNNLNTPIELLGSTESKTIKKIMDQYVNSAQRIDKICNSNLSSGMFIRDNGKSGAFSPCSD